MENLMLLMMYLQIKELNYYKRLNILSLYLNLYKVIKKKFLITNFKVNQDQLFMLILINQKIFQLHDRFLLIKNKNTLLKLNIVNFKFMF